MGQFTFIRSQKTLSWSTTSSSSVWSPTLVSNFGETLHWDFGSFGSYDANDPTKTGTLKVTIGGGPGLTFSIQECMTPCF